MPQMSPPAALRPNLRSQWMIRDDLTFLNHGSFGAVPRVVFDAQTDWRKRIEADPIEIIGRRSAGLIETAKIPVGETFGMKPADFGFVTNATEGVNAVLRSLKLSPGDELLTTNHVYHAVRQTMKQVARQAGATCREVQIPLPVASAQQITDLVLDSISPRTRLLVIDHVTSPTALVFPLQQIIQGCKQLQVEVLADAAHAPGMLPIDVESIGADYYTANLHKWVCAPKGTAILWVAPRHQAQIHPLVISHHLDEGLAREFGWQGTRDFSALLTAPAALNFMADFGWENVMRHNHELATWAHQMLVQQWGVEPVSPLDGSLLGSMATVALPGKLANLDGDAATAFGQRLYDEHQLELPIVRFQDRTHIRVSCQVYNVPIEYEKVAQTISKLSDE